MYCHPRRLVWRQTVLKWAKVALRHNGRLLLFRRRRFSAERTPVPSLAVLLVTPLLPVPVLTPLLLYCTISSSFTISSCCDLSVSDKGCRNSSTLWDLSEVSISLMPELLLAGLFCKGVSKCDRPPAAQLRSEVALTKVGGGGGMSVGKLCFGHLA